MTTLLLSALLAFNGLQTPTYDSLLGQGYDYLNDGKFAEAADSFKAALKIYDQDGQIWAVYGQAASKANRPQETIEAANKVLELGAFGANVKGVAYFEMSAAYIALKDNEKAWIALNNAMKAGFRSLDTIRTDKRLEPLHSNKGWEELAATKDVSKMSRTEGWRYDLWLMNRELRRLHKAPYLKQTPEQRDKFVKDLNAKIPNLTDDQIAAEFYRYVASFGDGHTNIRFPIFKRAKMTLFWFKEGVHIVGIAPEYPDLAGAKITAIQGEKIESLFKKIGPLISHENPQGILAAAPNFMTNPRILRGIGVPCSEEKIDLTVITQQGQTKQVSLPLSEDFQQKPDWLGISQDNVPLTLKERSKAYSFTPMPELNAVLFSYNSVRNDSEEPLTKFVDRMFNYIDENHVKNLIIDVRWNGGGNTFLSQPIHQKLWQHPEISQSGSNLYVIIGRNTYSAAQNFTTDIERSCTPIFVGEPTGSSPNFIGESIPWSLPYSKMAGTVSDLYWQRSWPMDERIWIAPQLPTPPSFAKFSKGIDPAMAAIEIEIKNQK
ncbi:MAG: hypothetical protein ACKVQS_12870 [Fimbriimonadaceae bacterium]